MMKLLLFLLLFGIQVTNEFESAVASKSNPCSVIDYYADQKGVAAMVKIECITQWDFKKKKAFAYIWKRNGDDYDDPIMACTWNETKKDFDIDIDPKQSYLPRLYKNTLILMIVERSSIHLGEYMVDINGLEPSYVKVESGDGTKVSDRDYDGTKVSDRDYDGTKVSDRDYDGTKVSDRDYDGTKVSDRDYDGTKVSDRDYEYGLPMWAIAIGIWTCVIWKIGKAIQRAKIFRLLCDRAPAHVSLPVPVSDENKGSSVQPVGENADLIPYGHRNEESEDKPPKSRPTKRMTRLPI